MGNRQVATVCAVKGVFVDSVFAYQSFDVCVVVCVCAIRLCSVQLCLDMSFCLVSVVLLHSDSESVVLEALLVAGLSASA